MERLRHLPATISAEQAAEILGVSVYVVRRSMDDGSLPTLRLGARVRRVSTIGLCQLLSG
jgi:excisionase family DNA binding protein